MTEAWKKYDEEKSAWQMPRHLQNFKVKVQKTDQDRDALCVYVYNTFQTSGFSFNVIPYVMCR